MGLVMEEVSLYILLNPKWVSFNGLFPSKKPQSGLKISRLMGGIGGFVR